MSRTEKYWLIYRCHARWHASGPYPGAGAARQAAALLLCRTEAYVVSGAVLDTLGRHQRKESEQMSQ
jgi:hypothetical protein